MKLERVKRKDGKEYHYRMTPEAAQREDEAKRRWAKENYDRLTVDVPKGMLEALTQIAQRRGISRRKLIVELLQTEIETESTD